MDESHSGQVSARVALADEVRAMIQRTGFGLERLAARLTDEGVQVSDSALSRYQRGQALPPKALLLALARVEAERSRRGAPKELGEQRQRTTLSDVLELLAHAQDANGQQSTHVLASGHVTPARVDDSWGAPLVAAADALAERVRCQWRQAAGDRRLLRPTPIPVRWCRSKRPVAGPIGDALGDPNAPSRLPSLPGQSPATATTLRTGGLHDLFKVYGGLGSGRMVILGRAGAGKSAAAILTLIDALEHRRALDDVQRASVPVPVLLTTHGWDPWHQRLGDWLAARLADDYPALRSRRHGHTAAAHLVNAGHIALFLDGLDEMAPTLRAAAVDAINRDGTPLRLVILTRGDELAVESAGVFHGAAALELSPVSPSDAAEYLKRCQTDPLPPPWQRLITHLREHPDSVLASALDSPLNLTLMRDAFADATEIDELLASNQFGTRSAVEDYLLDRIVHVMYQPAPGVPPGSYRSEHAERALSFIATRMRDQNTRDLAWWRMHHWASPMPRVLTSGLLGLVAGALVGVLVIGPLGQYTVRGSTGTWFGTGYGAWMGVLFGLLVGLVSEFRERARRRGRRRGWVASRLSNVNVAVALLLGLVVGLAVGNQSHLVLGAPVGLLVGLGAGRAATRVWPGSERGAQTWWKVLRPRVDICGGCLAGLPIGLAYGSTKGPTYGLIAGIVTMCGSGLMVGFSRPSADKDSASDPETSWRRARQRGIASGLASGLPLGTVLGIGNAMEEGLFPGIIAGIGFGTIIGLASLAAVSDTWRTTLVFLQLRRHGIPPIGMRFLKDAYDREILRAIGPIYQFRHARLQDRLADRSDQTQLSGGRRRGTSRT